MARVVSKRATGPLYIADTNILNCIVLKIEKEGKPKLALPIIFYLLFFISSNALANWSGHDVPFIPHGIPFSLFIASSIFIPSISLDTPTVFPAHPPCIVTFFSCLSCLI